ncbi:MAG: phosphoribosylanthranilate isomerase [Bacteroidia bacterium]|nr:phosphoribosylanthranilate isomerase [Bacteroidia bacterium]
MNIKIKICGMLEKENIRQVAEMNPDMIGFIFYPSSPRYAGNIDPVILNDIPHGIIKTGVFVNSSFDQITGTISKYSLGMVQLHGKETPEFCFRLKETGIPVIKAFGISGDFDFNECSKYISSTDYFLFDTSVRGYGGSGKKFDWKILDRYIFHHPFILSGGIGPGDTEIIASIKNKELRGVDINSRFEIKPGVKDVILIRNFISDIRQKANHHE